MICDDRLKEYNGNEMLQGTGHPAEKPELTPASQLDAPAVFWLLRARAARYGHDSSQQFT